MSKINDSEKNNRISKLFLIILGMEMLGFPVLFVLFMLSSINRIPDRTLILILIFSAIIWFILAIDLGRLYLRFQGKYLADKSSELGLREILEANMDLVEYDPLQKLPEQTLLNCSAIFPEDFFDGKIGYYGSLFIRGKYNDKSFEMSSVKLYFTRNTAGQPTEQYFNGTIVILRSKTNTNPDTLFLFPENDRSRYRDYVLRYAKLNKVMPSRMDNNWECFSRSHTEAERFYNEHADWFSCIKKGLLVRFIIRSNNSILLGIDTKLFKEDPDTAYMKEHFERTLKRILTCCVDPFES